MYLAYKYNKGKKNGNSNSDEKSSKKLKINYDKFYNKDQNFTINWFSSLADYYNQYLLSQ